MSKDEGHEKKGDKNIPFSVVENIENNQFIASYEEMFKFLDRYIHNPRTNKNDVEMFKIIKSKLDKHKWNPEWIHNKRKSKYMVERVSTVQCSTGTIKEGDIVYTYVNEENQSFVRKESEFLDGRFTKIEDK